MPPSLLSRFDLIFIMKDQPSETRDLNIANHILKSHSAGEEIMRNRKYPIPGADDEYFIDLLKPVTAEIDAAMLRKYLAYAKRNCFPVITSDAKNMLVSYYQKLRSVAYENNDKPVPVTARQLEALVRLAEASARVRLDDTITTEDASRVIKIVDECLRQVAYDPKSGSLDIDKIASSTTKAGRTLRRDLKNTIKELAEADPSHSAKIDDVYQRLTQQNYTRDEIEHMIEQMSRQGEILLPKNNTIKLVA